MRKLLAIPMLCLLALTVHAQANVIGNATVKGTASAVGGPPAAPAFALVHHAVGTPTGSSTSCPVTITGTTAGNFLLVVITSNGSTAPSTVLDSASNALTVGPHSGGAKNFVYYEQNIPSGLTGVTATFLAATGCDIYGDEFSGPLTSGSVVDASAFGASGNFTIGPTGTTAQASELIIGIQYNFNGAPGTITLSGTFLTNGATIDTQTNGPNGFGDSVAYAVVSSTGAYSYTGSCATNAPTDGTIFTLK
jgi:hypothetical protein